MKSIKKLLVFILVFLSFILVVDARAGGGGHSGGSHHSSHSSSSHRSSSYQSHSNRSHSGNDISIDKIIIAIFIVVFVYKTYENYISEENEKTSQQKRYNDYSLNKNTFKEAKNIIGEKDFKNRNPEFSKETFLKKVEIAFTEIQNAWSDKDLRNVRRYISDSVYQRFNVQFQMMNILEQVDKITDLKIISTVIDKYEKDGEYDVIHVGIMADITDVFTCKKYPSLNEDASERFIEYWSFIRKKGNESNDIYSKNNCPKCGSPLGDNMGEVSKCDHCGTITNKGDYDWILAEITQMSDYLDEQTISTSNSVIKLYEKDVNFSIQHIEDKVSNGYIQICKALAFNKIDGIKRFVSEDYLLTLSKNPTNYLYTRFYLNYVKLVNYEEKDGKDYLTIKLKVSYKRVIEENSELKLLDRIMKSKIEKITLVRDSNSINKGDLYSYTCPNCGGSLGDTINNECPYCNAVISSTKYDWIITETPKNENFGSSYNTIKKDENFGIIYRAKKFIKGTDSSGVKFGINEIILNNLILLSFADKEFHKKEEAIIYDIAMNFGFRKDIVDSLILLGKQDRLSLKFPTTNIEKTKMISFIRKALNADGKITPEEESLVKELEEAIII